MGQAVLHGPGGPARAALHGPGGPARARVRPGGLYNFEKLSGRAE